MTTGLIMDVLVSLLLVVMIGYAAVLSRRLSNLRGGKGELETAIVAFAKATETAEASVAKLKRHAGARQSDLQESIDSGRALRDELAFLLDRAEEQSKRLDDLIRAGRAPSGPSLVVERAGTDGGEEIAEIGIGDRSDAEHALLKTLAGLR